MKYRGHALALIRRRLETHHGDMPQSRRIAEKLDEILPSLRSHEAPHSFVDERGKSNVFENAAFLHGKIDSFLEELGAEENVVSNAVRHLLNGVVQDVDSFLQKHHQDA